MVHCFIEILAWSNCSTTVLISSVWIYSSGGQEDNTADALSCFRIQRSHITSLCYPARFAVTISKCTFPLDPSDRILRKAVGKREVFDLRWIAEDAISSPLFHFTGQMPYTTRLLKARVLLEEGNPDVAKVTEELGDTVEALDVIPMAIFCALRAMKPVPEIQV